MKCQLSFAVILYVWMENIQFINYTINVLQGAKLNKMERDALFYTELRSALKLSIS